MAGCPTHDALVTSALCSTLALSSYKVGAGPDSDEALSLREVDQWLEGLLLGTALSDDREEFPNMSRMGRDPELSEQGRVLEDPCSMGKAWIRSEHQAVSSNW